MTTKMYGWFDLREGCTRDGFAAAFDEFTRHLIDKDLAESRMLLFRDPHDGYDSTPLPVQVMVEVSFRDKAQALACWDEMEENTEPLATIHRTMNRQIRDAGFGLYAARDLT